MGGGITQKYLQDNHQKVSGGVLLASASPLFYKSDVNSRIDWRTIKALITLNPYLMIETPELMKKAFFSSAFPDSMAKEIHAKLDKNASTIGLLELLTQRYVDYNKIKCPMIVIGAKEDTLEEKHIKETADAYGVGYDMIEGSGHEVMLDLKWEDAANVIFNRVQERILNKK
jgi:alpha-beta hydrolase superfamily lysophospholipase